MIIVGSGRVGRGLAEQASRCGLQVGMVTRQDGLALLKDAGDGPVLVCTNADDIAGVVAEAPQATSPPSMPNLRQPFAVSLVPAHASVLRRDALLLPLLIRREVQQGTSAT